jgi:hypothetical protein
VLDVLWCGWWVGQVLVAGLSKVFERSKYLQRTCRDDEILLLRVK